LRTGEHNETGVELRSAAGAFEDHPELAQRCELGIARKITGPKQEWR
jgi:hypothetical protein